MARGSARQTLVWRRLSLRGLRRRLQRYRLIAAGLAGGIGAVLGATYNDISSHLRIGAIVAIGILTGIAVFLAEPIASPPEPAKPRTEGTRQPLASPRPGRPVETAIPSPAVPWWRRWRRRFAPAGPEGDVLFRGRTRELEELLHRHDEARKVRTGGPGVVPGLDATGPVILLIHGKPGVGKSALAMELARRLTHWYPHGQLYASFGTLDAPRAPAEILQEFLLTLGWPAAEIPSGEVDRARIFRSITARRRILFVFDAARSPDQIRRVLPSHARSTVIVTSRRDFAADLNIASYGLDVPDIDDAITLLRAASNSDEGARPECAVEIVRACGALPMALRAAAERTRHGGTELCHVAGLLEPEQSRLGWLERPGTSVAGRIASEYERLLDQEQRALRLLTLVESPSFVPWVLVPLLGVPAAEAENLATRLSTAQMLDNIGRDEPTGLARYRFHPLVRLYAQARLRAEGATHEQDTAQEHLDAAYREAIAAVLNALDPTLKIGTPRRYFRTRQLAQRIAQRPEPWVREEYPSLLRHITLTHSTQPALCWRIAAWLDGCVPPGTDPGPSLRAYELAVSAAEADQDDLGLIHVLMAQASLLTWIENYGEAQKVLQLALDEAARVRRTSARDGATATRLEVQAKRKLGEGYLQMASYREASAQLRIALDTAIAWGEDEERAFIQMLLAETHHIDGAPPTVVEELASDAARFRACLLLSEAARRRKAWPGAHEYLSRAAHLARSEARRTATVSYRTARLHLDQYLTEHGWPDLSGGQVPDDPDVLTRAEVAVRRAAEAAVTFRRMGNAIGELRSHCLLARTLVAAGYLAEAERVANTAHNELEELRRFNGIDLRPLRARLHRAQGDLMVCRGDLADGRRELIAAATLFGQLDDFAAETEAVRRLRETWRPVDATLSATPSSRTP